MELYQFLILAALLLVICWEGYDIVGELYRIRKALALKLCEKEEG